MTNTMHKERENDQNIFIDGANGPDGSNLSKNNALAAETYLEAKNQISMPETKLNYLANLASKDLKKVLQGIS